jgi:iodotyrosine deiodinase
MNMVNFAASVAFFSKDTTPHCGTQMTPSTKLIPLPDYHEYPPEEMIRRAADFYREMRRRRTVRHFSDRQVPWPVIEHALLVAGTAPNGANLQPWHFAVVGSPEIKHQIRVAAEKEEHAFYNGKAPQEWLDALAPLGTDENKPFLEVAPYLIVIFAKTLEQRPDGKLIKNYYVNESVGIATGFLISALHRSGLATLTHTPSPMKFLNQILKRPTSERPFLLLVVGYPAEDAMVPNLDKKPLDQIMTIY